MLKMECVHLCKRSGPASSWITLLRIIIRKSVSLQDLIIDRFSAPCLILHPSLHAYSTLQKPFKVSSTYSFNLDSFGGTSISMKS